MKSPSMCYACSWYFSATWLTPQWGSTSAGCSLPSASFTWLWTRLWSYHTRWAHCGSFSSDYLCWDEGTNSDLKSLRRTKRSILTCHSLKRWIIKAKARIRWSRQTDNSQLMMLLVVAMDQSALVKTALLKFKYGIIYIRLSHKAKLAETCLRRTLMNLMIARAKKTQI